MFKANHTCLQVENLNAEILFYEKALSFRTDMIRKHNDKVISVFISDPGKNYQIQLLCGKGRTSGAAAFGHIAMQTDDIKAAYELHSGMKCVVTDIVDQKVQLSYFIEDPEGYQIEIIQFN